MRDALQYNLNFTMLVEHDRSAARLKSREGYCCMWRGVQGGRKREAEARDSAGWYRAASVLES
jgi:hypothetical protein